MSLSYIMRPRAEPIGEPFVNERGKLVSSQLVSVAQRSGRRTADCSLLVPAEQYQDLAYLLDRYHRDYQSWMDVKGAWRRTFLSVLNSMTGQARLWMDGRMHDVDKLSILDLGDPSSLRDIKIRASIVGPSRRTTETYSVPFTNVCSSQPLRSFHDVDATEERVPCEVKLLTKMYLQCMRTPQVVDPAALARLILLVSAEYGEPELGRSMLSIVDSHGIVDAARSRDNPEEEF